MKLLIVAPYFPPYPSVAVVRIASLTRYLISSGFEVTILTNKYNFDREKINIDDSLKNINKIEVDINKGKGKFFSCRNLYIEEFQKIMQTNKFDCVLITSGPFYTLPLCKIAKVTYDTRCIIDFRDLWIFDVRTIKKFISPRSLVRKIVFFPIEKQALKYADCVVTVTKGWSEILKRIYPQYKNKITVIYNGYDDNYLNNNSYKTHDINLGNIQGDIFKIMSFGKLSYYSKKYSCIFFSALNELQRSYSNIRVIQVGNEEKETKEVLDKILFDKEKYINTGFCDYRDGIILLSEADVNILIDIRKRAIGTKIYDYIFVNKPIIYIGKKSTDLSKMVDSFENGFSCQTKQQVLSVLIYIIKNDIKYLTSSNIYKKYSREFQNNLYIDIFDRVKKV